MPVNKVKRRGSYAPLSSHYYKDDRLIRAGEKAELLYVRALAFCADVLNDGCITDAQLAHVGVGMSGVKARAKALVEVGAWQRVDDGYQVVAWLSWNKSRDDILVEAKKDCERKGVRGSDQPLPPEPPPDFQPEEDPYPGRNPNGIQPEAERNPDGFQPLARRPAPAPSTSRAEPEPEPAPTELALVPRADDPAEVAKTVPLTINKRAQALAAAYRDKAGKLTAFVAVMKIVKAALEDGWSDDLVETALMKLIDDNRPVTMNSLAVALKGPPKAQRNRPAASDRAQRTLSKMQPEDDATGTTG